MAPPDPNRPSAATWHGGQSAGGDAAPGGGETIPAGAGDEAAAGLPCGGPPAGGQRYAVERHLDGGGMGVVEIVEDLHLGRRVARKRVRRRLEASPRFLQRFEREARIVAQLQHPSIVPVYEMGTDEQGRPWFTMKLVDGRTLDAVVAAAVAASPGALDRARRDRHLDIFVRIGEAVAYAHSRGVLHRDLKPANVMVGRFGEVQVLDWGLAGVAGAGPRPGVEAGERRVTIPDDAGLTEAGARLGTPGWSAPEQLRGEPATPRSDVFSLGCILRLLCAGQRPVPEPGPEPGPWAVPAPLESVIRRATDPSPAARHPTVRALLEDVRCWRADLPVPSHPYRMVERAGRWARQNGRMVAAAALGLATLGASGAALRLAGVNETLDAANATLASSNQRIEAAEQATSALLRASDDRAGRPRLAESAVALAEALAVQPDDPVLRGRLVSALNSPLPRLVARYEHPDHQCRQLGFTLDGAWLVCHPRRTTSAADRLPWLVAWSRDGATRSVLPDLDLPGRAGWAHSRYEAWAASSVAAHPTDPAAGVLLMDGRVVRVDLETGDTTLQAELSHAGGGRRPDPAGASAWFHLLWPAPDELVATAHHGGVGRFASDGAVRASDGVEGHAAWCGQAVDGDGALWTGNGANGLWRMPPGAVERESTVTFPSFEAGCVVASDHDVLALPKGDGGPATAVLVDTDGGDRRWIATSASPVGGALSRDGRRFALTLVTGDVEFGDARTGRVLGRLRASPHSGEMARGVALSADGAKLAVSAGDVTALYALPEALPLTTTTLPGVGRDLAAVATGWAVCAGRGEVLWLDPDLSVTAGPVEFGEPQLDACRVSADPRGLSVWASQSQDVLWRAEPSGEVTEAHRGPERVFAAVAFGDDRHAVAVLDPGRLSIVSGDTLEPGRALLERPPPSRAFQPPVLLTATDGSPVALQPDVYSGLWRLPLDGSGGSAPLVGIVEGNEQVWGGARSPDGRRAAFALRPAGVAVVDASGAVLARLDVRVELARGLAFSPDGALLAIAGDAPHIEVWDWAASRQIAVLDAPTPAIAALGWPEAAHLVVLDAAAPAIHRMSLRWLRDPPEVALAQVRAWTGLRRRDRQVEVDPEWTPGARVGVQAASQALELRQPGAR